MTRYSYLTHLQCTACGREEDAERLQTVCPACGKVLYARYDLDAVRQALPRQALGERQATMWRYHELLPVRDPAAVISLGEGMTPLLPARRLAQALGCSQLFIKEEGLNPTGSFKARGQAAAVSRAVELGATALAIPSAGNAGGALAAYAARAGVPAYVFMPLDAPQVNKAECALYGARLYLVQGLISDCGRLVRQGAATRGWFDVSTLREPYRQEGKKTMGYELAEQFGWTLPDAILYPTGGGTGIVGMWKAFEEMERLGWIDARRPKLISVQAAGCAPIVRAYERGQREAEPWADADTVASGIRVPAAIGDYLMLDAIRASGGTALTVTDEALVADMLELARLEGLSAAPEGAATLAALRLLLERGTLGRDERIVLFNTGAAWKYAELGPQPAAPVLDPHDPRVQELIQP
ncbi:MAG TPA: threonine synthase [Chloroflexota bacterium]|nr:threonine synthase [Chloroflexota bacterium]